ncbi:MAG TPA: glycosyltransferase [Vicinamibacterales bacterium]|nr:glycosyltransferase [Vicinamibacterales bacterium]
MTWPPDVDVAIVAHNNLATLPETLQALLDAGCPPARITIVDIASTDETSGWLGREHPAVHVRRLDRNEGPNPARNIGITESRSRFVLLMDADVRLLPDTVPPLHAAVRNDASIKIATPIVVRTDHPELIQYSGGAVHFMCEAVNPWLGKPISERGSAALDIGAAPGCALLIDRQAAIEIGLFDERYFMGKDDGDFIHRMHMAGYRIREIPQSLVLHDSRPRSDWMFYYQIRNRWHFILKNYEARTIAAMLPALIIHEPLQFVMLAAKGHAWTYVRALGGLLKFLPALPRDRALARRIRRRHDRDVLISAPMVVRDDVVGHGAMRRAKDAYDCWLDAYWRLLTRTILAR